MKKVKVHKLYDTTNLCLRKRGECPFCEANKVLLNTGKLEDAELAKRYKVIKVEAKEVENIGYMPYEYLEIIVKGGIPTWSEDGRIWITKYTEEC